LLRDPLRTLVAPYIANNIGVFHCPADSRKPGLYDGTAFYPNSGLKGQVVPVARSVSMSQAVGTIDPVFAGAGSGHGGVPKQATNGPWLTGSHGANNASTGPYATFGKSSSFRGTSPAQVFMMADESQWSLNDAGLATCANVANPIFIDYPSSAHNNGCSFSYGDGHADSSGREVVKRELRHLREVRHRRLPAVRLPVRVRRERRRGLERLPVGYRGKVLRIEGMEFESMAVRGALGLSPFPLSILPQEI
jgi:prepilin-type processing-associated H-X9-DG protein